MARPAEALHDPTPRPGGGATDENLVAEMANGSSAALQELFRRVAPLVYALAVRIERDEADAEEVLVDSFYQAWRQAGDYDRGRGKVVGWLLSIARSREGSSGPGTSATSGRARALIRTAILKRPG